MLTRVPSSGAMEWRAYLSFRAVTFFLACVLGVYSVWLLGAELQRTIVNSLPLDRDTSASASHYRVEATWAAWSGLIRGDLWTQSAFTFADLLWTRSGSDSESTRSSLDKARHQLDSALSSAPTRGDAWLLLAGLASRFHWSSPNPAEALRMSYYTGPNEFAVMALRTLIASQMPVLDADMQQLARRDVRLLLARQQKSAVIEAYHLATPNGQRFIEQELGESDPSFVKSLRRGAE